MPDRVPTRRPQGSAARRIPAGEALEIRLRGGLSWRQTAIVLNARHGAGWCWQSVSAAARTALKEARL